LSDGACVPKPELYAADGERASFELLPVIRLRRRDQQGSTHIPAGVPPRQADHAEGEFDRLRTALADAIAAERIAAGDAAALRAELDALRKRRRWRWFRGGTLVGVLC
jgi:hypothetical protein